MKILHLSSEKTWRGGEQQIAYLLKELRQKGVKCFVACRKGSPFEDFCQREKIPFKAFAFGNQYEIGTALGIKKYCQEVEADIMHLHSSKSHMLGVIAHMLGAKARLVLSRRVDFQIKQTWLTQFKYNYPAIDRIICVSKKIEEIARASVNRPDRCTTVHSGIDVTRFRMRPRTNWLRSRYGINPEKWLVGNTSALAPHKDYFTFLDTASILLKEGVPAHFFIIGEGALKLQLQRYVREKGLKDAVTFTGFLQNIPEVLPGLDLFLITSEEEGLGTSVLDAFACGVPVVATRAGGIPEMVLHEETGLAAPVKQPQLLAREVQKLLQTEGLAGQLAGNARRHLQHFTRQKTAAATLNIYKEILQAPKHNH